MQILRHSKIALTMEIYTEVPSPATRAALRKLGNASTPERSCTSLAAALCCCTKIPKGRSRARNRPLMWWAQLGSNQ